MSKVESSQISQVAAVVDGVKKVLATEGKEYSEGINYREIITGNLRAQVVALVQAGILSGVVRYSKLFNPQKEEDVATVHRYTVGMVDNHLRKSHALNGVPRKVRAPKKVKAAKSTAEGGEATQEAPAKTATVLQIPRKKSSKKKSK